MKLFKYALLLVVLIFSMSVAAADLYNYHISSGTYATGTTNSYMYGSSMTVEASSYEATTMTFKWYAPGSSNPVTENVRTDALVGESTRSLNAVGQWRVEVRDGDSNPTTLNLYFWVQGSGVSYNIVMTGTDTDNDGKFQIGNTVTCTVTPSTSSSGQSMRIMWYLGSTHKQTHDVSKTGSTYVDTLAGSSGLFDTAGNDWHVEVYESSSSSYSDSTRVGSGEKNFEGEAQADDIPEFPIGSFVPLLLAGAIYIKVRRDTEGS